MGKRGYIYYFISEQDDLIRINTKNRTLCNITYSGDEVIELGTDVLRYWLKEDKNGEAIFMGKYESINEPLEVLYG